MIRRHQVLSNNFNFRSWHPCLRQVFLWGSRESKDRSTMLSSMPMGYCTLRHGTRSQSGASSAPPSENRRLSLQPFLIYVHLSNQGCVKGEADQERIKKRKRELLSASKLYHFHHIPPPPLCTFSYSTVITNTSV